MVPKRPSRAQALTELDRLALARERVLGAIASLPAGARIDARIAEWSPDDVLRHLLGWDRANLRAIRELLRGELPSFYLWHDADWRSFNARLVHRYRRLGGRALIGALRRSHAALLAAASRLPPAERARDRGVRFRGRRVTISRLLEVEARDEIAHARALRSALARWRHARILRKRNKQHRLISGL